jgi:hypothetical protein
MYASHTATVRAKPLPWIIAWLASFIVARIVVESEAIPFAARLALALVPLPLGAIVLRAAVRAAQALDELERRVQLEALATAFLLTIVLLMTLGLVERVVTLNFEDWSYLHVWGMLPLLYFVGLLFARRRYHEEPPQD